jgi:hypothetical protein
MQEMAMAFSYTNNILGCMVQSMIYIYLESNMVILCYGVKCLWYSYYCYYMLFIVLITMVYHQCIYFIYMKIQTPFSAS